MKHPVGVAWGLVALVSVAGLGACGEGSSVPLNELSPQEAENLCRQSFERAEADPDYKPVLCTWAALQLRDTTAECQTDRDRCVSEPLVTEESLSMVCADWDLSSCARTVAEYEACSDALFEAAISDLSGLSCDDVGTELPPFPSADTEPACAGLYADCPELFGAM